MTTKKDVESLYSTVIFFGLISVAIWFVLIRPLLPAAPAEGEGAAAAGRRGAEDGQHQRGAAGAGGAGAGASQARQGQQQHSGAPRATCTRVPPHLSERSAKIAAPGGTNLLADGLLAFRHCRAASHEAPDEQASNRKDRARVLSRLLLADSDGGGSAGGGSSPSSSSTPSPPAKGSTLVVSVPSSDVSCSKLRRVLYLLATYYNLLVILVVDGGGDGQLSNKARERHRDLILELRGGGAAAEDGELPVDVLPDHRIVGAGTVAGRVAFLRQLQRVELMVDYDPEVKSQLCRFGHRVVLYGQGDDGTERKKGEVSSLGSVLLP